MNLTELRDLFWQQHPHFSAEFKQGKRQNSYNATTRSAWVDFVDNQLRDGQITESLANRATL